MAALDLYFDYISPYAYLAVPEVMALARRNDATVRLRPTLFAALLDAHGHKGPAEIPSKRVYVFKHVLRLAHAAGRRLAPPPTHPFNPLLALRVSSLDMPEPSRVDLVGRLFEATWGGGPGITEPEIVASCCDAAGLDGASLVAEAATPEAKATVRATTEAALSQGVFGVPTVVVDDELFWGGDALPHLEAYLQGRDPLDADAVERWARLPAGAERPAVRR